jgi:AmmeMemoRadiSam system protein B
MFYPASAVAIRKQIAGFIEGEPQKTEALACMLPHAGYVYSGRVAVQTLSSVNIRDKIILLGPNHTGNGAGYSIMTQGYWQTPLGRVRIESALAESILKSSQYLKEDALAHLEEHSLEVELPILQYFKSSFEIVPIAFMSDDLGVLKKIGLEIAQAISSWNMQKEVMLVASSDMTHYEPLAEAQEKDKQALKAILEFNPDKLMQEIKRLDISMCGYAPVIVMLSAAHALGARNASLVKYQTSADASQDESSVVGYAGVIFN